MLVLRLELFDGVKYESIGRIVVQNVAGDTNVASYLATVTCALHESVSVRIHGFARKRGAWALVRDVLSEALTKRSFSLPERLNRK